MADDQPEQNNGELAPEIPPDEPAFEEDAGLADAAREATAANPQPPGGAFKESHNFKILGAILLLIVFAGVAAFVWMQRVEVRGARVRLDYLEKRLAGYEAERAFVRQHGYRPAGEDHPPLTPEQLEELRALRSRFGYTVTTRPTSQPR